MMADHAARIGRLVDDLLSLSRIERSEAQTPDDEVALRPAVDRAVEALAWRARERGVRIVRPRSLNAARGAGRRRGNRARRAEPHRQRDQYGAADSTVTVEAKADAAAVAVAVSDEDRGSPPNTSPASRNVSTGWTRRVRTAWAARVWGWLSSSMSRGATAARSTSPARPARAAASPSACAAPTSRGRTGRGSATRNRSFPVTANLRARHRRRTGHGRLFAAAPSISQEETSQ